MMHERVSPAESKNLAMIPEVVQQKSHTLCFYSVFSLPFSIAANQYSILNTVCLGKVQIPPPPWPLSSVSSSITLTSPS